MNRRTKLEGLAEGLISLKLLTSVTGIVSDRARRRYEKVGEEAYKILKTKRKLPENSDLLLKLTWSDQTVNWARNLGLAIEEFRQRYPKYGNKLDEIIKKHRETRRAYLEFGLIRGELPSKLYIEAIKEVAEDLDNKEAKNVYESVRILERAIKKKKEKTYTLLLPE